MDIGTRTVMSKRWISLGLIALVMGCGLVDENYGGQPLAVINGNLREVNSSANDTDVSLAIFWQCAIFTEQIVTPHSLRDLLDYDKCDLGRVTTYTQPVSAQCDGTAQTGAGETLFSGWRDNLEELVRYESTFPVSFSMELTQLPPPESLGDLTVHGGNGVMAMGSVVAYQDLNGNAKFDFSTPEGRRDQGLAHSAYQKYTPEDSDARENYFVIYLDGAFKLDSVYERYKDILPHIPEGFSLWVKRENENTGEMERTIEPIDTVMELVAEPGIENSWHWCEEELMIWTLVDSLEEDEIWHESCQMGGLYYTARGYAVDDPNLPCTYRENSYEACVDGLAAEEIPEDWPCTIE